MSRTGDPAHPGSSEGAVPAERRASEQTKETIEDASCSFLVDSTTHQTSELVAQARTDDFLVPWDAPKRQPSVSLGNNETSSPNLENEHYYSRLQPGSIRLLRLMPDKDESAGLQCQLFDYPLESSEGTHLYEALSYVWGDPDQRYPISVDGRVLSVTANLFAALVRLRDRLLDRIVWIDAICINQDDNEEKGNQIQYMAEIYSKASRVVVWLGEAENDGERALDAICRAADEMSPETMFGESTETMFDESAKEAILALLRRPWFNRIWVLQEVAAARNVLVKCGSTEIDGYAFSAVLTSGSFKKASPDLRGMVHSVTYLVMGAAFRPKKMLKSPSRFSLRIRPIGELIEMYCTRKAAKRHDKVFALLGMSSDDPIAAGLSPDYEIPWERLLERLVRHLLGEQVSVKTWPEMEMAEIRGEGSVLGRVSRASYTDRVHQQQVIITLKDASGNLGPEKEWTLPPTVPVQVGDLVCLLSGAMNPTIIRPQKDHFSVMIIAAPCLPEQPTTNVLYEFLFVWDWEKSWGSLGDRKNNKVSMGSRMFEHPERGVGDHPDGMTRWNMALILEDGGRYKEAEEELREIIGDYESQFGEEDLRTLTARDRLAQLYNKTKQWEEAKKLAEQVIQTRIRVQGTDHPDTAGSRTTLALTYRGRGGLERTELGVIISILERREGNLRMAENETVNIAGSFHAEMMKFLLGQRGAEVKITEGVVTAAAGNGSSGKEIMRLLLEQRGAEVKITEGVVTAVAGNQWSGKGIMKLLLEQRGAEVKITEGVVTAAAGNRWSGKEIMKLLLEQRGAEVKITEGVVIAAVGNGREEIMRLLLEQRGAEVKITEGVVTAAAGNEDSGKAVVRLLLEQRGAEVKITEGVVTAAAGNRWSGKEIMKLLLEQRGAEVKITEGVVIAAVGNGREEIMRLLLEQRGAEVKITEGAEVKITEGIVIAVAGNRREEIIRLLLEQRGAEVKIIEAKGPRSRSQRVWSQQQQGICGVARK
ncbi:heterokaryon incompatibility protein-domain-containing protein [Lasiosphaeria hispida]|uniref:Heterokaryon incompatibility protein-domain-containing protein n=1 Tax=Lasiosphaeria hispida TaxID=260671 RepID=A0AAJ0MEQ4_9PEZI|nr:heterokaryon incompatibility protein-domain-containing protein [Lasiosphaeria hispida]